MRSGLILFCACAAFLSLLAVSCAVTVPAREGGQTPAVLDALVRAAWMEIGGSSSKCEEYDYFPNGGMRNWYCHILTFVSYRKFADLIGVPIFISGPHTATDLTLDSPDSFGRYNKEFVARLRRVLIPGENNIAFRTATQGSYDRSVRPLARIFFVTYRKLKDNPSFLEEEKRRYLALIRSGSLKPYYYEKFFYFMNSGFIDSRDDESYLMKHGFDGGWDGNVVKTCVAFWIRRSIDGTAGEFYAGLEKLLQTYDGTFLADFSGREKGTRLDDTQD